MSRLNDRAFEILRAEVQKCSGAQVQRDIALKRLERLRSSQGSPASVEELRDTLSDIFPNFSENATRVWREAELHRQLAPQGSCTRQPSA